MALNKAKIITVTSVKGGTGKTTTVLNIAGILTELQKKTIIIDLDLYSGVINASLNLKNNSDIYTLNEDMMNNRFKKIDDYTNKYNEYIDILPAPIDPRSVGKINLKFIDILLSRLQLQYEVILIDTNHIIDKFNLIAFDYSDTILYLVTNDLMDIKNMKNMIAIFEEMEQSKYQIILNESIAITQDYSASDIASILERNIDYVIPQSFYNRNIQKYIYDGTIMITDKPIRNSKGAAVIEKITKDIFNKE